jgi:hypothetical protein
VVKLHALALVAREDVSADADPIGSIDRLVRENAVDGHHVVLPWKERELTFGVNEGGEQTFPVLASLLREDPSLAQTILRVLDRPNGATEDVPRAVAGDR